MLAVEATMKRVLCTVSSNREIAPEVYLLWLEAPDIAERARPGQFVTVRCGDLPLRRPFSIHQVSSLGMALLIRVAGKGTFWLSQRRKGDKIDVLGPLGNGFSLGSGARNLLLVGGGVGVAPLVFLMQRAWPRCNIVLIHGVSTAAHLYPFSGAGRAGKNGFLALPQGVQLVAVTEDGGEGRKGSATDVLPDFLGWADQVYACGPLDMYRAMAEMSSQRGADATKLRKCQVSLEVRMGCGFGACYGCTINTRVGLRQVCRHGPIFELGDILWQEVKT